MKIGLVMPSIYASEDLFPDKIFAPRELFTSLSNGLIELGHDVIVYSVPDVATTARVIGIPTDTVEKPLPYYKFRGLDPSKRKFLDEEFAKHQLELACITRAFEGLKRGEVDLLHVYLDSSYFISHYLNTLMGDDLPVVYTLHDPLPPTGTYEHHEFTRFAHHNYIAISESFRRNPLALNYVATIYHGIPVSEYTFVEKPGDALLFLGRLAPEKGLHSAIKAAASAKIPLTVSTNAPKSGETNEYYEKMINPLLHGETGPAAGFPPRPPTEGTPADGGPPTRVTRGAISLLPVVDKKQRISLYGQAKALLFPIEWEEPFGIVVIEAMATGTPVIAYNRGSVPELIHDGVTGFIVDPDDADRPGKGSWIVKKQGVEGIVEAIGLLPTLDRHVCREHIIQKFSAESMARAHVRCYQKLLTK